MKSLKYIPIFAMVLGLASCESFFNNESPSAMDQEYVFTNVARTGQAVEAIYDLFGNDKSYRNRLACGHQGLNTDIEHCNKNSGKADYAIYAMATTSADLSTADGKDPWGYLNSMVERSNGVIEGIEKYGDLENPQYQYYLGEALFLRSFVYMELVKLWGDVPARFESLAANGEGMNMPKSDRNIIFEHCRADLRRAAELLPWSAECPGKAANFTGRPSKAAALALLARLDLTYAGYALRPDFIQIGGGAPYSVQLNTKDAELRKALYKEAMEACAQIMNNPTEDKKLLASYEQIFRNVCADVEDYSKSEIIWELPFANGTRGQVMNYNMPKSDKCLKGLKNNTSGSSNSVQGIVPTFWFDFEEGDVRRDVTIVPFQWYVDDASGMQSDSELREIAFAGSAAKDKKLYQKNMSIADFYLGKYRVEWMSRDRNGNDDGTNFPIIRYADVLLMFCEASLGGIEGDVPDNQTGIDAQTVFNRVRARAGLGAKTLNMANLMDERKFEFCGEYIRKYDLQRWGMLKTKLVETTARLAALNKHEGEFAQTGDSVYFKYKTSDEINATYLYAGEDATAQNAYVMDSVYGLNIGEVGRPATFDKANGWIAKCIYRGESGVELDPNAYILYADEETIDKRHFFPIFGVNVGSSNGALWNDYDYE